MNTYIVLLRAVNVGGTGKLPMAELRAMCAAIGFADVRTYIASGNLVQLLPEYYQPANIWAVYVSRLATSSNGLLARRQPDEVLDYPLPGRIPGRGALWVRFGEGAAALVVVIAHLSLGPAARARQLAFIAELIGAHPHVVLMGDFNATAHAKELDPVYAHTALVPPQHPPATFPSWRPRRAIDHILVSKDIEVEQRWALPHPVSDHLPIAATLRLPAALVT